MDDHLRKRGETMTSKVLARTLAANAGFSALTGLILIGGASPLSRWLGIPTWLAVAVGVGLLPFAVSVIRVARDPKPEAARMVIFADIAWVIGAAVVLIGFPRSMSTAGLWSLGLVSVAVADFAVFQAIGLRRLEATVSP
jgi:hypothetical protein